MPEGMSEPELCKKKKLRTVQSQGIKNEPEQEPGG